MAILQLVTLIHWYQNYCNVIAIILDYFKIKHWKSCSLQNKENEADTQIYDPQI